MYRQMGEELVENVRMLYEQVDAQYVEGRPSEERVGHQIAVSSCCSRQSSLVTH
jgi:hypothetical protein